MRIDAAFPLCSVHHVQTYEPARRRGLGSKPPRGQMDLLFIDGRFRRTGGNNPRPCRSHGRRRSYCRCRQRQIARACVPLKENQVAAKSLITKQARGLGFFEKYLTVWVLLCIAAGIALGRIAPGAAKFLDGLAVYSRGAPVVSIPIAVCLFLMMFPIMVKIDFREVVTAGRNAKPVSLTLSSTGRSSRLPCMPLPFSSWERCFAA